MSLTTLPAWMDLTALAKQPPTLAEQINQQSRNATLQKSVAGCLFDFSKQRVDKSVLEKLQELASQVELFDKSKQMFAGEIINRSEHRAVLHAALRGGGNPDNSIIANVEQAQTQLRDFAVQVRNGLHRGYTNKPIMDIVHIGIGGSHLGPELVVEALSDYKTTHLNFHFLANIDANSLHNTLKNLNPETTLFIVASKSFGTLETKVNALSARSWFIERTNAIESIDKHFVGITSNIEEAIAFGLDPNNLFPMWDWVGGRYSLWSTVGLPILLSIGADNYDNFLAGAQAVDQQFAEACIAQDATSIPSLSALLATWNYNFLGAQSLAVISYDERLRLLPEYLQQLEMESNGKSVTADGKNVDYATMPVLWGGVGTKGQHAYHQLLHQGTQEYCADFIIVAKDARNQPEHHQWLNANALGQSQAMAIGYQADSSEPHRNVIGNHPTTTIVMDELGPMQLGALLATYEHKVFCQGVIWDINSFDQWGVELGKNLAVPIQAQLAKPNLPQAQTNQSSSTQDAATQSLINYLLSYQNQ